MFPNDLTQVTCELVDQKYNLICFKLNRIQNIQYIQLYMTSMPAHHWLDSTHSVSPYRTH